MIEKHIIQTTIMPIDATLMTAEGKRLRPLAEKTTKPLLKVDAKPIIEYNVDSLIQVGIKNIYISVNYLSDQIEKYFCNGSNADKIISELKLFSK